MTSDFSEPPTCRLVRVSYKKGLEKMNRTNRTAIALFLGLSIFLGLCIVFYSMFRPGLAVNSMPADFSVILRLISEDIGDDSDHEFCRTIANVDWENVCNTELRDTAQRLGAGSCGTSTIFRPRGLLRDDSFTALSLYDFNSFQTLSEVGFVTAVDDFVPNGNVEEVIKRNVQENYRELQTTFYQCPVGNFVQFEGVRYQDADG